MVVMRLPRKQQNSTTIKEKYERSNSLPFDDLRTTGMYVLISSFEDDDNDGNDDGEKYIYNPENVKVGG